MTVRTPFQFPVLPTGFGPVRRHQSTPPPTGQVRPDSLPVPHLHPCQNPRPTLWTARSLPYTNPSRHIGITPTWPLHNHPFKDPQPLHAFFPALIFLFQTFQATPSYLIILTTTGFNPVDTGRFRHHFHVHFVSGSLLQCFPFCGFHRDHVGNFIHC